MGHATRENRHGPACSLSPTAPPSVVPRRDAETQGQGHRITTGEDKAYDTADDVANLRAFNVTPHVTQNNGITKTGKSRRSAIENGPRAPNAMACRNRAGR